MGVVADLVDAGAGEVLLLLARRRRTGELRVVAGEDDVRLYLTEGCVVQGSAVHGGPLLGELLVRAGRVAAADLRRALRAQAADHISAGLGRILVKRGLATRDDLAPGVAEQCAAVLSRVVGARQGVLGFRAGLTPPVQIEVVPLPAADLVDEAASRARQPVPAPGRLPEPTASLLVSLRLAETEPLGTAEAAVVAALRRGAGSLAELAALRDLRSLGEVALRQAVRGLLERRLLIVGPGA